MVEGPGAGRGTFSSVQTRKRCITMGDKQKNTDWREKGGGGGGETFQEGPTRKKPSFWATRKPKCYAKLSPAKRFRLNSGTRGGGIDDGVGKEGRQVTDRRSLGQGPKFRTYGG